MGPPFDHAVSAFLEDVASSRAERQDPAGLLRRDGPDAAHQRATAAAITGATWRRCCWPAAV